MNVFVDAKYQCVIVIVIGKYYENIMSNFN